MIFQLTTADNETIYIAASKISAIVEEDSNTAIIFLDNMEATINTGNITVSQLVDMWKEALGTYTYHTR